jgi:hypothetical protein
VGWPLWPAPHIDHQSSRVTPCALSLLRNKRAPWQTQRMCCRAGWVPSNAVACGGACRVERACGPLPGSSWCTRTHAPGKIRTCDLSLRRQPRRPPKKGQNTSIHAVFWPFCRFRGRPQIRADSGRFGGILAGLPLPSLPGVQPRGRVEWVAIIAGARPYSSVGRAPVVVQTRRQIVGLLWPCTHSMQTNRQ